MPDHHAQARYWLLTIPVADWSPPDEEDLPNDIAFIKGQREIGEGTGYEHWQLLVVFSKKLRLRSCKERFCETAHCEPSRSVAADAYVWKEDTAVPGTRFSLGVKPLRRNNATDWDDIWKRAVAGDILSIESNVRIQHYRTLRTIRADFAQPVAMERKVVVYHGPTGTGKSRRAWEEATWEAYPKDPRTKFWDGYSDQKNVVIDEYRGDIGISNLLRWFDRYPVLVEIKGSSTCLVAEKIWITSNLHPKDWYKELDYTTYQALERRLEIIEIQ